jgi:polysaccharide export outer membrane protein
MFADLKTRWLAVALLGSFSSPAFAEYRLDVGDVLEFSVAGMPNVQRQMRVDGDGIISVPLAGDTQVLSKTLAEVSRQIKAAVSSKTFTIRTQDGREALSIINGEEISISIVEYRPVYVAGDVSRPGAQTYRPGLTVRQVISLAGGYDIMRFRMEDPLLSSADIRTEYNSLLLRIARQQARLALLRQELGEELPPGDSGANESPIAKSVLTRVISLEQQSFDAARTDYEHDSRSYRQMITNMEARLAVLSKQFELEQEGARIDAAEYSRTDELWHKGTVPITRVVEARRLSLLSATQALQLGVQIESTKKERDDLLRVTHKVDIKRRLDLIVAYQEAYIDLIGARNRLRDVGEKLLYSSAVRSSLTRGKGGEPEIAVFRKVNAGQERLAATLDSELQPGDVVDVTLRIEQELMLAN